MFRNPTLRKTTYGSMGIYSWAVCLIAQGRHEDIGLIIGVTFLLTIVVFLIVSPSPNEEKAHTPPS